MSSYSKGAQGLSVFLRVHGIFTATSISPSLWPRQCGDRYAIRAGRNLPDKEFRYLRTVIVTARRLPGLQFGASLALTPPFNLPAPGRRQSVYVVFTTSHRPMFLVNSRHHHFSAAPSGSTSESLHLKEHPFFRRYGVILPSSLARVLSSALDYSSHPPELVSGTVCVF